MKKIVISLISLFWALCSLTHADSKDLEIKGRQLISQKPPFTLSLPTELRLIHSFSHDNPKENSLTRAYFFIKEKNKQVEEMLIVQIADRTNPQAGPITASPPKPYTEKRTYLREKRKKGELEIDYLIQLMAWNPDAPSLQPIRKRGMIIPHHWAMQGQSLFVYYGEHAVLLRYSKDVNAFGLKISEEGKSWETGSISGNEKKVYENFRKRFSEMLDSIQIKNP